MLSNNETNIDSFRVYIRIRPLNEREKEISEKQLQKNNIKGAPNKPNNILISEDNLLFVLDPDSLDLNGRRERSYIFDGVFSERNINEEIFDTVIKSMIENVLKGYNSTALAYGVTGAGKTHTMFGDLNSYCNEEELLSQDYIFGGLSKVNIEKGVCLYAVDYLFNQILLNDENKTATVKISYLEIYNEQVIDLLNPKSHPLMIVEDNLKGVVVPDLTELTVTNSKELIKIIVQGNSRRTMAATNQNQFSSRSHAIVQIVVEQRNKVRDTKEEFLISKFLIVDLAGSERGGLEKGLRTQEGANINKSLLSLGNCINILSDKSKKGAFVPYRDSKLTRLLKDSLGGNISTAMIACVSPSFLAYDETVNTLKYATRARTIQKKITKNIKEVDVHISQYKDIIDSLKNEIEQLKAQLSEQQIIISEGNRKHTLAISEVKEANNPNIIENEIIDSKLNEKYIMIQNFFEKYLELINDKLIENIEQNMILKFNMKEILDLNETNAQHLAILFDQIKNLEKIKIQSENDQINEEINKLKEETNNIEKACQENEKLKQRISESLTKNLKYKKILKMILIKLVSKSQLNIQEKPNNTYEKAYKYLVKEKVELENKNLNYQKYLTNIITEKEKKDKELSKVNKELESLKNKLKEKDKRIKEIEQKIQPNSEREIFNTEDDEKYFNTKQECLTTNNLENNSNINEEKSNRKTVESIKYIPVSSPNNKMSANTNKKNKNFIAYTKLLG